MAEETPPLELPADAPKLSKEEKQELKKMQRVAARLVQRYQELNQGGAPISEEFVLAALQQGLTAPEINSIARSQALGGPKTSESYSSTELLDYFTANPGEIRGLLNAVRSVRDVPRTYAEYLAQGGVPGGYRAYNQVLQEAVLGLGGAREAYLAGAGRPGVGLREVPGFGLYDPASPTYQSLARQGVAEAYDVTDEDREDYNAYVRPPEDDTGLAGGSAAQGMVQSRQARVAAQGSYFPANDLIGEY